MRFAFIDGLGWSGILLWLALSMWSFFTSDGAAFQSVGVVGIASAVAYFALQRHATTNPVGTIESDTITLKSIALASDAGTRALAKISIVAKVLVSESLEQGRNPNPALVDIANISPDHIKNTLERDPEQYNPQIEEIEIARLSANAAVERARRNAEVLQASVVVLGTLQSGLGSAFIDLVR